MKKSILFLTGIAICLLVSCNDNPYEDGGGGNNPPIGEIKDPWWSTTGELTYDGDELVLDEVDLHITTVVNGTDYAKFQDIVSDFNREYLGKINVTTDSVNQVGFEQNVANRINQNTNAPDLIMSHQKGHKGFVNSKLIQPFNEIFTELKMEFNYDDYATNIAKYGDLGYENYVFDVPIDAQSMVVYYNKTLLNKYNTGKLPTSRSEFFELCKRVQTEEKKTDSKFQAVALQTEEEFYSWYLWPTALVQNGATFYNEETYKVEWTSPDNLNSFKNALSSIREMFYGENKISEYGQNLESTNNLFFNDQCLFIFSLPWSADDIFSGYSAAHENKMTPQQVQDNYVGAFSTSGLFALDEDSEDANKIYGDSHAFALSKTVSDINVKAAAAIFVNWFNTNVDVAIDWARAGHISANNLVSNETTYKNDSFVSNYINNFYPDINEFVTPGNTPYFSTTFEDGIYKLGNTLIREESSSKDATTIAQVQKDVNDTISLL